MSWDWAFWYRLVTLESLDSMVSGTRESQKFRSNPNHMGGPTRTSSRWVSLKRNHFVCKVFGAYDQVWTSISPEKIAKTMGIILLESFRQKCASKKELRRWYDVASVSVGFYFLDPALYKLDWIHRPMYLDTEKIDPYSDLDHPANNTSGFVFHICDHFCRYPSGGGDQIFMLT